MTNNATGNSMHTTRIGKAGACSRRVCPEIFNSQLAKSHILNPSPFINILRISTTTHQPNALSDQKFFFFFIYYIHDYKLHAQFDDI